MGIILTGTIGADTAKQLPSFAAAGPFWSSRRFKVLESPRTFRQIFGYPVIELLLALASLDAEGEMLFLDLVANLLEGVLGTLESPLVQHLDEVCLHQVTDYRVQVGGAFDNEIVFLLWLRRLAVDAVWRHLALATCLQLSTVVVGRPIGRRCRLVYVVNLLLVCVHEVSEASLAQNEQVLHDILGGKTHGALNHLCDLPRPDQVVCAFDVGLIDRHLGPIIGAPEQEVVLEEDGDSMSKLRRGKRGVLRTSWTEEDRPLLRSAAKILCRRSAPASGSEDTMS